MTIFEDEGFDPFGYSYHRALTYTLYIYSTKKQSTGLLILIRPMIDRPVFALKVKNPELYLFIFITLWTSKQVNIKGNDVTHKRKIKVKKK